MGVQKNSETLNINDKHLDIKRDTPNSHKDDQTADKHTPCIGNCKHR